MESNTSSLTAHILVVDDDREIRQLVGDYLRKNGFRISLAADGRQMREALDASHIDFIVLDLMLPGDDGLTLCRNLRATPAFAQLPVLMLTARGEPIDRVIGLEMGRRLSTKAFRAARAAGENPQHPAPGKGPARQPCSQSCEKLSFRQLGARYRPAPTDITTGRRCPTVGGGVSAAADISRPPAARTQPRPVDGHGQGS